MTLRFGLGLGQSHPTQLRVEKDGVGHKSVIDGGAAAFEEISPDDAEIVVGDVPKGWAVLHRPEHKCPAHWFPAGR
jgi:hypothetical protein